MKSEYAGRSRFERTLPPNKVQNYFEFVRVVLESQDLESDLRDRLLGLLRSRSVSKILDLADSLAGTEYPSAHLHYRANQIAALFKKVPFDKSLTGFDPEKAAIDKFLSTERRVGRYNLRHKLRRKYGRYGPGTFFKSNCASWIRKVIGDEPQFPLIWKECRFGPGASVFVSGNATHLAAKYLSQDWSVTKSAQQYALAALRSDPKVFEMLLSKDSASSIFCIDPLLFEGAFADKCKTVDYNKLALVPKTARVNRTIAVEPLLNGYLQNGVDSFFRKRLRRFGIDLTSQDRNRELARLGSIPCEDPYVTIDLSEASDSISIGLCEELLPRAWYLFLSCLRSPNYLLNKEKIPYEKFCSMGNGFCFPLETLIFSSVCHAVYEANHRSPDFSVYGDDIIVRQSLAKEVLKRLRQFGFRHNPDKTFLSGPFRESCGADWYLGEDVRPVTVNSFPDSLGELFTLHNKTLRSRRSTVFFEEGRDFLRSLVPPKWRFVRPCKGQADTAFEVERDLAMASPHTFWNRETWSWKWRELVPESRSDTSYRKRNGYHTVLLQAALLGASSEKPFTERRNTRTRVGLISHHGGYSTWLPST